MDLFLKYKHLLHRTTFGVGQKALGRQLPNSIEDIVEELFTETQKPLKHDPIQMGEPIFDRATFLNLGKEDRQEAIQSDREKLRKIRNDWIYRMASEGGKALSEKMTLFWHGHLACQCNTSKAATSYLNTLRRHALGNIKSLVLATAKEPAMLRFLNNQQNRKGHPNENFARELLELFTMGEGNYSEADVKEAARAFTGWGVNRNGDFRVRPVFHDFGEKHFMGNSGRLDGSDIIDIIFKQTDTAHFIAQKLYRYFVNEKSNDIYVGQIAKELVKHNYEITPVLKFIFTQPWFYNLENVGTKIKSPVDLIVQIVRLFNIQFRDPNALSFLQRGLGQMLFSPPNVAGWPGGRSWINNATLMLRLNLTTFLLDRRRFDHATATPLKAMEANRAMQVLQLDFDMSPLIEFFNSFPYSEIEVNMKRCLLATDKSPSISSPKDRRSSISFAEIILRRITSLPEFQMC